MLSLSPDIIVAADAVDWNPESPVVGATRRISSGLAALTLSPADERGVWSPPN
jgi:hypothetical protein